MEMQPSVNSTSKLIISDDVIASISANAAKDINGVTSLAQKPNDVRTVVGINEGDLRFIDVSHTESVYAIKVYINVAENVVIPTVAADVQKAVKNAVQSMTGFVVSKVNVVIAGVEVDDKAPVKSNN